MDPAARGEVEKTFIEPFFDIDQGGMIPTVDDYRDVPLLEVRPPDVARYFVRVKPDVLARFADEKGLAKAGMSERDVEDEFVYQNSIRLNNQFYASLGDKRAFVMSHARNLLIMKIVGFAEAAVQYYRMPDTRAHVWIAHQRYPTKGRVWHPGGAHPFIGLNEALVHNGDFANYHSVSRVPGRAEHLPAVPHRHRSLGAAVRPLEPRVPYPIEYIIEALAPTTELDFDRLPAEKQRIYRQIQAAHIHASPDGPWFFIIARSLAETEVSSNCWASPTRPCSGRRCSRLQEGEVSIGLICSEKQAIDATLASLASEDPRFTPVADIYWNARGGSHTDGGAFLLTVSPGNGNGNGTARAGDGQPNGNGRHDERPLRAARDQQVRRAGRDAARPGPLQSLGPGGRAGISPRTTLRPFDGGIEDEDPHAVFAYLREQLAELRLRPPPLVGRRGRPPDGRRRRRPWASRP